MWINMSFAKTSEAFEKEGLPVLYRQENMQKMTGAEGFIAGYALLLHEDHTQACSLSLWKSREDAEAWFASQEYIKMVGEVIQHIQGKPDRRGYEVSVDMKKAAGGEA